MIDWLDEFYASSETRQLLEESFAPLFAEYGAAVAAIAGSEVGATPAVAPFIQAIASTYIGNYLSSSKAQMQEMLSAPDPRAAIEQRLAEWAAKRPGKVAQEATVQTSNAVTQTVYKDAGVTRKKWNARGKSCPYCRRMNGKVVGIDRPFHKEGDSIEVPDSEISAKAKLNFTHEIGHPPQHQGCDCVIEADMTSQQSPTLPPSVSAFERGILDKTAGKQNTVEYGQAFDITGTPLTGVIRGSTGQVRWPSLDGGFNGKIISHLHGDTRPVSLSIGDLWTHAHERLATTRAFNLRGEVMEVSGAIRGEASLMNSAFNRRYAAARDAVKRAMREGTGPNATEATRAVYARLSQEWDAKYREILMDVAREYGLVVRMGSVS